MSLYTGNIFPFSFVHKTSHLMQIAYNPSCYISSIYVGLSSREKNAWFRKIIGNWSWAQKQSVNLCVQEPSALKHLLITKCSFTRLNHYWDLRAPISYIYNPWLRTVILPLAYGTIWWCRLPPRPLMVFLINYSVFFSRNQKFLGVNCTREWPSCS